MKMQRQKRRGRRSKYYKERSPFWKYLLLAVLGVAAVAVTLAAILPG